MKFGENMKEIFLEKKLNSMSLSEKIGQLLMIDYRCCFEMNNDLEKTLQKYTPGGFIVFKSNIENYKQTKRFLNEIKVCNNIKTMIATDQEGGRVQRLGKNVGFENYQPMLEVANNKTISEIFNLGYEMGIELKNIGIDMNMAPVLDIFSNPKNRVIANRAFGTNAYSVSQKALSFADGLKESGVIAVGKHFPGHGDTQVDSHIELPVINKTYEELKAYELIPFNEAIARKIPALLIAHISMPNIINKKIPTSLSPEMIEIILRSKLGYTGLVIPDSLKMKALSKYYSQEEIYLNAIKAGNDILLMPQDIKLAFETIYNAVNDGVIDENRINQSVMRILSIKFDYQFFKDEYNTFIKNSFIRTRKK